MTKIEQLREALRKQPGMTLRQLQAQLPMLGNHYITDVCGQLKRAGKLTGDRKAGYTLAEDNGLAPLQPRIKGNRAALRAEQRASRKPKAGGWIVLNPAGADAVQIGGDHYKRLGVQPWDAMQAWGTHEEFTGFLKFNAVKYLARESDKGGLDDLKKARHYLDKLIEVIEAKVR